MAEGLFSKRGMEETQRSPSFFSPNFLRTKKDHDLPRQAWDNEPPGKLTNKRRVAFRFVSWRFVSFRFVSFLAMQRDDPSDRAGRCSLPLRWVTPCGCPDHERATDAACVFCAVVCWRCVLRFRFRTDAGLSSTLNDTMEPSWCSGRSACAPSLLTSYLHRSYIMMSSLLLRNELRSFALLIWYATAVLLAAVFGVLLS